MTSQNTDSRIISPEEIRDALHPVSFNERLYHIPSDELTKIYDGKSLPSYALLISSCENALACHDTQTQKACNKGNGCFQGFQVRDKKVLVGIAEAVKRDRLLGNQNLRREGSGLIILDPEAHRLQTRRHESSLQNSQSYKAD